MAIRPFSCIGGPTMSRAERYIGAGADMTFVSAPEALEEINQIPRRLTAWQMLNMVLGGKTPIVDRAGDRHR
jgi:2-methylisocitrate lyase-like PEP mutase family enzyme